MTDMADLPGYVSAHIQERLAAQAYELGIRVDVRGDVVHLRGEVVSEERRRLVEEIARGAAAGREIRNEVHVVAVGAPDDEERLS
ncbi:BON domain-containing protein [Actinomadura pelletieri DSM 43383]|uniref:BON domain-containing protein n=1 Tax=Actinomadura pelletieri DSM 43383 TaxID=1120940 RepID=A0A495QGM7_9ACTN|nr:BON domain-containing protein [Actinomadura pelletieri]RKS71067.1 BON domain-containing protein [Actinomadura pelletieri DSM 43383]